MGIALKWLLSLFGTVQTYSGKEANPGQEQWLFCFSLNACFIACALPSAISNPFTDVFTQDFNTEVTLVTGHG